MSTKTHNTWMTELHAATEAFVTFSRGEPVVHSDPFWGAGETYKRPSSLDWIIARDRLLNMAFDAAHALLQPERLITVAEVAEANFVIGRAYQATGYHGDPLGPSAGGERLKQYGYGHESIAQTDPAEDEAA